MLLDWLPFAAIVVAFFVVWWRRSRVRDRRKQVWRKGSQTWSDDGYSGHSSHGGSARHSAAMFGAGASGGAGASADWDSSGDSSDADSGGDSGDSGGDGGSD
jgi:hypothetical protein